MSAQPHVELTGPRLSAAVSCPRRATYQGLGYPAEPATQEQQRYWRRGHAVSDAIRGEIVRELREENRRPRAEESIPWPPEKPIGTGHADLVVPHERLIIEVTSRAGAQLDERKALQVAAYAVCHKNADQAVVIAVDPSDFTQRNYPIDVHGLEPRVREIMDTVATAIETESLPDRVCRHPGDGPAQWCEHAEKCFAGWTRPEPDVLLLDEEAVRLADATDLVTRLEREAKAAKAQRDQLRDELRPYLDAGVELETPSLAKLRRTEINGRRTLSLADMTTAGFTLPEQLESFVSEGKPSERWTVKRRA